MNIRIIQACVLCTAFGLCAPAALAQAAAPAGNTGVMPPQPNAQADAMFSAWDSNHDGTLSREEFRAGFGNAERTLIDRRLHAQFNALDANKDGYIDAGEYQKLALVKRAGTDAPALSQFDGNRDGKLNFAEYTDLVRHLAAAARPQAPAPAPAPKK